MARDTKDILKQVRQIEIKTKRLSNHIFSGEYHSSFKGRGMSFAEVREYQYGDDIRAIDWNVTARLQTPYIKVFEEERELTMMLLVDVSGSEMFGTQSKQKSEMITEICAVLAFSAIQNNDKVGVIFFSDKVEKYIPPKKGKSHILRIIRELVDFKADSKATNIEEALRFLSNVMKKKAIVFVLSDFMDEGYQDALSLVSKRHDAAGIRIYDPFEKELPSIGITKLYDPETGQQQWVNTNSKNAKERYKEWFNRHEYQFKQQFRKAGVGTMEIATNESYVKHLLAYFKQK